MVVESFIPTSYRIVSLNDSFLTYDANVRKLSDLSKHLLSVTSTTVKYRFVATFSNTCHPNEQRQLSSKQNRISLSNNDLVAIQKIHTNSETKTEPEFMKYYLPFAKFIAIRYSGEPDMKAIRALNLSPQAEKAMYRREKRKLKNLFEHRRSTLIYYEEDGIHLLYDIISKLQTKHALDSLDIDFRLEYRCIPHYDDDDIKMNQINYNEIRFTICHKSRTFLSQVTQTSQIASYLFSALKGFVWHPRLVYNTFEYKLFCFIRVSPAAINVKWIEIDNGHFNVDMNCCIDGISYEIADYPSMKNDCFEFQTLRICNGGALTVKPFGHLSPNGYLMGAIRIHCSRDIMIDEDCELHVNGTGYYGKLPDQEEEQHYGANSGCGAAVHIKLKKKTKSKKSDYSFGAADSTSYYSGGGYGTRGGDCVDRIKQKTVCVGGGVYGEKRLSTLYFGSSGGKGGRCNDKSSDRGGGCIELCAANELRNAGSIRSNGRRGQSGGGKYSGGSGGSIKIVCHKLTNKGRIEACGGRGHDAHGDGGNGRIAIYTNLTNKGGKDADKIEPQKNLYCDVKQNAPKKSTIFNNRPLTLLQQQQQQSNNNNNNQMMNNNNNKKQKKKKQGKFKKFFRFK
eukprot:233500_1